MKKNRSRQHQQGFTLIDVLLSFALVVVLVLGAAQLTLQSLMIKRRSDYNLQAAEMATSKLEYMKSLPFECSELQEGSITERIRSKRGNEFYVREWEVKDVSPDMKAIEMEAFCEACPQKMTQLVLLYSRGLGF